LQRRGPSGEVGGKGVGGRGNRAWLGDVPVGSIYRTPTRHAVNGGEGLVGFEARQRFDQGLRHARTRWEDEDEALGALAALRKGERIGTPESRGSAWRRANCSAARVGNSAAIPVFFLGGSSGACFEWCSDWRTALTLGSVGGFTERGCRLVIGGAVACSGAVHWMMTCRDDGRGLGPMDGGR